MTQPTRLEVRANMTEPEMNTLVIQTARDVGLRVNIGSKMLNDNYTNVTGSFPSLARFARALLSASKPAAPQLFEEWATKEGLISESHGVRFVNSMCDVAQKAWNAALAASPAAPAQSAEPVTLEQVKALESAVCEGRNGEALRLLHHMRNALAAPQPAQNTQSVEAQASRQRVERLLVELHSEGRLSEGQCAKVLDIHRIEWRKIADDAALVAPQPATDVVLDDERRQAILHQCRLYLDDESGKYNARAVLTRIFSIAASPQPVEQISPIIGTQAPFSNCRFKFCDLPGQCRDEGKCHHPAVPAAQRVEQTLALTDSQLDDLVRAVERKLGIYWYVPDDSETFTQRPINTDEQRKFVRALLTAAKLAGGGTTQPKGE
ncbi:hypothetical protein [Paraburkholderia dipogonis]|uniref:hypothetical protein n=1 Tax=Paraburkholderia dipogonis TaxID=1211383 RepID=UPI0038BD3534